MIREKLVKQETHDLWLPDALHVFSPAGDHIFIGPHRGETIRHASFAEKTFEQGVFEVLADLQASLRELADMHVVPPGHIPFIARNLKDRTVGLAEAATIAFGNFIINGLQLLAHGLPQIFWF
jgi:hypothetical protein